MTGQRGVWQSPAGLAMLNLASALWRDGRSINEIAARLGCSRNVIAGLAHRFRDRFPARGAPTGLAAASNQLPAARALRSRLRKPEQIGRVKGAPSTGWAQREADRLAALPLLPAVRRPSPWRTCQWMDGDPRVDATRCGASCLDGRSWCAAHAVRVYARAVLVAQAGEVAA